MKKGVLAVIAVAVFVFVTGFSLNEGTVDTETNIEQSKEQKVEQQEKVDKIFDNAIDSHIKFYEHSLSESNRNYLRQRPEILEELFRNPRFVLRLDNALQELSKPTLDNKDIQYLYTHDDVDFKERKPEPTSEPKLNTELINKLENN